MSIDFKNLSFCRVVFTATFRMYAPEDAEKDDKVSKNDNWLNKPERAEIIVELELRDGYPKFFGHISDMTPECVVGGDTFKCTVDVAGVSLKPEYVKEGRTLYLVGAGRIAAGVVDRIEEVEEG